MDSNAQSRNAAVVRKLCERWAWLEKSDFLEMMTSDVLYLNLPWPERRTVGPENVHAMLSGMKDRAEIELKLVNIVAQGDVVLTERLELIRPKGKDLCELYVMGSFDMRDGKIAAWRDYFDAAQIQPLMG